jgi:prolipoprotein diacylglyceryltransferase
MEFFIWDVNPVLIEFFGLKIHWYGALFATAILAGLHVMKWIFQQEKIKLELLDSLLMYCVFGIIVGARLGHCLFYDPGFYFSNPLKILAIWEGGLASHGGGLGVIIAVY